MGDGAGDVLRWLVSAGRKDRPYREHAVVGPHPPGARQVLDDADAATAQGGPRGVRGPGPGRAAAVGDRDLDRLSVDAPGDAQPCAVQRPGMTYRVAEEFAEHQGRIANGRVEDADGEQLLGQAAPRDRN